MICFFLPLKDATSLSITCQYIRSFAEKRLWTSLCISPHNPKPSLVTGRNGTTIIPGYDSYSSLLLLQQVIDVFIIYVSVAPWRKHMLKTLSLSLYHIVPRNLGVLLDLCSDRIKFLKIDQAPGTPPWRVFGDMVLLSDLLNDTRRFSQLRCLEFKLNSDREAIFLALSSRCPPWTRYILTDDQGEKSTDQAEDEFKWKSQ